MADDEEKNAELNKVLLGLGIWTAEELADPTKKLYYETTILGKKDGVFRCFCCSYKYRRSSNVVLHIAGRHPRFIHKPLTGHHCGKNIGRVPRGRNIWTKEELADPTKKLFFKTTQLEKVEGRYKCLSCSYDAISSTQVVHHISAKHPKFVHEPAPCQRKNRPCTKFLKQEKSDPSQNNRDCYLLAGEQLSDPSKKIFYSTLDLEIKQGKYKCFRCQYESNFPHNVVKHITRLHREFVYKSCKPPSKKQPQHAPPVECEDSPFYAKRSADSLPGSSKRRSSRSRRPVDYSESGLLIYNRDSDTDSETMDYSEVLKMRARRALNENSEKRSVYYQNERGDPMDPFGENHTFLSMGEGSHAQNESEDRLSDGRHCMSRNVNEDSASIEYPDMVEMDYVAGEDEVDETEERPSHEESYLVKDALLREYQAENEHLAHSISSLQTSYEKEIAKLREELRERSYVEMNQLLCPKEEMQASTSHNSHSATDRRVFELQRRLESERKTFECLIAAKDEELEHLKQKMEEIRRQFLWENAKTKEREEQMSRKFWDAESELVKSRKTIELKERAEKLKLEEELEEQRLEEAEREAQRVMELLEEKKRAKEERLQEMQKIEAELSFIN